MINPNVVEGQIAGGAVQGIGGALMEDLVYDDDGNPLATTFMDYLLPTATDVPPIEFGHVEIPGPGPGGYKGVGEGGAIGLDAGGDQRDRRRAGAAGGDDHPAAGQPGLDRRATDRGGRREARIVRVPPSRHRRRRRWSLLAELGDDAKIIAGGQSLVPMLAMRLAYFDHLIDISRLSELHGIERRGDAAVDRRGDHRGRGRRRSRKSAKQFRC